MSFSIAIGGTQQLSYTVLDGNGQTLTGVGAPQWSSSDNTIATVNSVGLVTGVAFGTATITARLSGTVGSTAVTVGSAASPLVAAPGAVGVWLLSETSGRWAYNSAGAATVQDNLFGAPSRAFDVNTYLASPWQHAFTSALTDNAGNNRNGAPIASRIAANAAQGAYLIQSVQNLPAGQYTMSIDVASNTGGAQLFRMSADNGSTFSSDFSVPSSGWTRFSYTFQHSGGTANLLAVTQASTGAAIDLLIYGAKLNTGASATAYVAPTWDAGLGIHGGFGDDAPIRVTEGLSLLGSRSLLATNDTNLSVSQLSAYAVIRWDGTPVQTGYAPVIAEDFNAANANTFWFDMGTPTDSSNGPRFKLNGTTIKDAFCAKISDGRWHVVACTYDGVTMKLYVDDTLVAQTTASISAVTIRQLWIATFNATAFFPGECGGIAFYTTGHSLTQVKACGSDFRIQMAGRNVAMTPLQSFVAWEGDSISDVGSGLGYYPRVASLGSTKGAQGYNPALSGSTIADLNARAAFIDSLYDATRAKNILHVLIGANDSGIMGASYWTNSIKPYVAARRAVGWKVVVATILTRTDATGIGANFPTNRNACNAAMVADSGSYDGISRFDLDPIMGPDNASDNSTYFAGDKLHPILAGHRRLGVISQAAVDALL